MTIKDVLKQLEEREEITITEADGEYVITSEHSLFKYGTKLEGLIAMAIFLGYPIMLLQRGKFRIKLKVL